MKSSIEVGEPKVTFANARFRIDLPNSVSFSFPIAGNWRLENATAEQLTHVEVDEDGLHWPDIDEDLSFEHTCILSRCHQYKYLDIFSATMGKQVEFFNPPSQYKSV